MLGIVWKICLSTSVRAASRDLSRTCHVASVLRSSWLFCWASELNSASRWQPNAPSSASLCDDAPCSDNPLISSREVRTAPPLPQERLPQPSEPDEYFNRNGTKSRLSLSLGLIFFYKTKQKRLARLRAGCNSIPLFLINAQ